MSRNPSFPRLEKPGAIECFYQALFQLDLQTNAIQQLDRALHLIVEITGARTAYVEVFGAAQSDLSRSVDVEHRTHDTIAASISRELVTRVVAERRTIALTSRTGTDLVATLCVPIKADTVIGIVWLENQRRSFSDLDRERARLLARRLAAIHVDDPGHTLEHEVQMLRARRVREALQRCGGNISAAARTLGVSRVFVYSVSNGKRGRSRRDR